MFDLLGREHPNSNKKQGGSETEFDFDQSVRIAFPIGSQGQLATPDKLTKKQIGSLDGSITATLDTAEIFDYLMYLVEIAVSQQMIELVDDQTAADPS